jgi:hypothetical protein
VQILANRTRPVSPALTNSIGGNNTSAPIYWRRHIHILNRHGRSNLQDDYSVYIASPIGAVITERNILTPLHLFVVKMPI